MLPAPEGAATLTRALRRLDAAGVTPDGVALRKPTLDDVFLALTGHAANNGNGTTRDHHTDQRMEAVG